MNNEEFTMVVKNTVARILVEKKVCTAEEFNKVLNEETDKQVDVNRQTRTV